MNILLPKISFLFVITATCLLVSQSTLAADKKESKAGPKINFDEHVRPILRQRCGLCHNADKAKGGLNLDTFTSAIEGGSSGEVIEPGDLESSRLWALVNHDETPEMPPKQPKLPKNELALIKQWILNGALENSGSKAKIKKKSSLALAVSSDNKPTGPPAMPQSIMRQVVVHTKRPAAVSAIASSPWAPLIAVAGQRQISLYHSETKKLLGVLPFLEGIPHVLKFSRNGSLLLAGGGQGSKQGLVAIYDVKTGRRLMTIGDELDLVLAADINNDHTMVALGGPGKLVKIYSTADGSLLHTIKKHNDWIYALEFSPDGVLLATADRSGGMFVWEADTAREYLALKGHRGGITDVSWRSDSNILASSSDDRSVKLWEMNDGKAVKSWTAHGGGVSSVRFARSGQIATSGRDNLAKAWDGNGKELRRITLADITLDATLSHDSSKLIAGDWLGNVRMWDVAKNKELGTLSPNPPTLEMRLQIVKQAVDQLNASWQQANTMFVSAQLVATEKTNLWQTATKDYQTGKSAVAAVSAAIAPMEKQIQATTIELQKFAVQINTLKETGAKLNAANADLTKQLAVKNEELKIQTKQHAEIIAVITKAKAEIQKFEQRQVALIKKVEPAKVVVNTAKIQLAKIQAKLLAAEMKLAGAPKEKKAELEKIVQQITALAKQSAVQHQLAKDALRKAEEEVTKVKLHLQSLTKQVNESIAQSKNVVLAMATVNTQIAALQKQSTSITQQIKQATEQQTQASNQQKLLLANATKTKAQLATKKAELTATTVKMNESQNKMNQTQQEKAAAENNMIEKQKVATAIKTQFTAASQDMVQVVAEKKSWDELPTKLKNAEQSAQAKLQAAKKETDKIAAEYAANKKQLDTQQANTKQIQVKIAALQAELAKNQKSLQTAQKTVAEKQNALLSTQQKTTQAEASAQQINQAKTELEARLKIQQAAKK